MSVHLFAHSNLVLLHGAAGAADEVALLAIAVVAGALALAHHRWSSGGGRR